MFVIYRADIGQPKDFLRGMSLYLEDLRGSKGVPRGAPNASEEPPAGAPEEGLQLVSMPSQERALVEGPHIIGNVLVVSKEGLGFRVLAACVCLSLSAHREPSVPLSLSFSVLQSLCHFLCCLFVCLSVCQPLTRVGFVCLSACS